MHCEPFSEPRMLLPAMETRSQSEVTSRVLYGDSQLVVLFSGGSAKTAIGKSSEPELTTFLRRASGKAESFALTALGEHCHRRSPEAEGARLGKSKVFPADPIGDSEPACRGHEQGQQILVVSIRLEYS